MSDLDPMETYVLMKDDPDRYADLVERETEKEEESVSPEQEARTLREENAALRAAMMGEPYTGKIIRSVPVMAENLSLVQDAAHVVSVVEHVLLEDEDGELVRVRDRGRIPLQVITMTLLEMWFRRDEALRIEGSEFKGLDAIVAAVQDLSETWEAEGAAGALKRYRDGLSIRP